MLRSVKEIKAELTNRRKTHYQERDEEGRVLVELRVRNDDGFLSPYSSESHNVLSQETADFIEKSLRALPVKERLHFRVRSDVIAEEEAKEYTKAIHDHYADCYEDVRREKKRLACIAWIMVAIGVFALAWMICMEITGVKTAVISAMIDIFAWVFLWEAVDIFCLQLTVLNLRQKRYLFLTDSVVEYLPLEKNGEVKTCEK